jgi:hypothetical protein
VSPLICGARTQRNLLGVITHVPLLDFLIDGA